MPLPVRPALWFACLSLSVIGTGIASSARAQDGAPTEKAATFETLFAGHGAALTLTLKDMAGGGWKRIKVGADTDKSSGGGGMADLLGGMLGGALSPMIGSMMSSYAGGVVSAGPNIYYTKGQVLTIGSESYLMAYQPEKKEMDFTSISKIGKDKKTPTLKAMNGDTPVTLSLLNLRNMGHILGIQPVNLEEEIAASQSAAKSLQELMDQKDKDSAGTDDSVDTPAPTPPPHKAAPSKATPKKKKSI